MSLGSKKCMCLCHDLIQLECLWQVGMNLPPNHKMRLLPLLSVFSALFRFVSPLSLFSCLFQLSLSLSSFIVLYALCLPVSISSPHPSHCVVAFMECWQSERRINGCIEHVDLILFGRQVTETNEYETEYTPNVS